MKFTRPLYRELFAIEETRNAAVETFKERAMFYHPICRAMVAKDLGVELGELCEALTEVVVVAVIAVAVVEAVVVVVVVMVTMRCHVSSNPFELYSPSSSQWVRTHSINSQTREHERLASPLRWPP